MGAAVLAKVVGLGLSLREIRPGSEGVGICEKLDHGVADRVAVFVRHASMNHCLRMQAEQEVLRVQSRTDSNRGRVGSMLIECFVKVTARLRRKQIFSSFECRKPEAAVFAGNGFQFVVVAAD